MFTEGKYFSVEKWSTICTEKGSPPAILLLITVQATLNVNVSTKLFGKQYLLCLKWGFWDLASGKSFYPKRYTRWKQRVVKRQTVLSSYKIFNQQKLFYATSLNKRWQKNTFSSRSYCLGKYRATIQRWIPSRLYQAIPPIFVVVIWSNVQKIYHWIHLVKFLIKV